MIFAADTEERTLHVFPDSLTAASYCDGLDAEGMLFWDDRGQPLEPDFDVPNRHGLFTSKSGVYHLVPATSADLAPLADVLDEVRQVVGEIPYNTVEGVQLYLRSRPTGAPAS
jgi:hypothetical protein